jgi:hypothetical protein
VLARRAQPSGNQQRTQLVAVQPSGVRLIIQPGTADVGSRGVLEQVFLQRIPVEPGDRAQPAGDGGPGATAGLQVTGETLDVGAAGLEQAQVMLVVPARVLAQVQLVRLAGQAAVAGQESRESQPLGVGKHRHNRDQGSRGGRGETPGGWAAVAPATMIHPTVRPGRVTTQRHMELPQPAQHSSPTPRRIAE